MNLYEKQRERLAAELQGKGIRDERVLAAIRKIPRHLFVPEALAGQAYNNTSLPIGEGQTISQPFTVARMLELLALEGGEKVLEIGTGSGYQAALLAILAGQVFTIERIESLARQARKVLDRLDIYNVNIRIGDGTLGWSRYEPFEAIVIAAAGPEPPPVLLQQLTLGGRMAVPLGDHEGAELVLLRKTAGGLEKQVVDPCRFVPLIGKDAWPG
ncbi:MAG: protein-L-isoaspartate O-methyltransferase [Candidatus Glassbacteria bacterium RIFCSPLOWO2_12_FULL_58_11]|uniref:Protein-L-isoaspartate O-methyltransferase n=2 Tax=Candidatus Glassiibacteriota TaxID=1817805 RepID=A0A1F5YPV8_9BACT|nr:MAG: protein-L-isoaspartate O-methyltransferase [Candidatus Glassbacteria bacterium GWA2_58_10]OGG02145.1 MAG: protein-L-isoaspartate O-methyltransferase [Candidatus Glassbacteria bacterium RIFCSPLOWO2_12_FULL_58_11]